MTMRVTYDKEVDAAYLYLAKIGPGGAKKTYTCDYRKVGGTISLDFDKNGVLVGIEFLDAKKMLPAALLKKAKRFRV